MSNKWTWVFGILTAAAFILGALFFAATQQLSGRDWIVLGIGGLLGATVAALIATFVFHADVRVRRFKSTNAIAQANSQAVVERLNEESRARIAAGQRATAAEEARQEQLVAAQVAQIEKKTSLIAALPSRVGRIAALKDEVAQFRISIAEADGNYMSGVASARDAAGHGFSDMAYERQATARTWEIAKSRFEEKLPELEAELDSVAGLSDDEYIAEQQHLRGLD